MLKLASLLQHEMLADVADGSSRDVPRCPRHVCFTADRRH